jgi:hypothetical protein
MRFLLRLLGYILVAAGFVALVIDGARSIANANWHFTALGEVLSALLRERYLLLQPTVERQLHPLLWDPILLNLTLAPAALIGLLLGFLLLRLGARPAPSVGLVTRR